MSFFIFQGKTSSILIEDVSVQITFQHFLSIYISHRTAYTQNQVSIRLSISHHFKFRHFYRFPRSIVIDTIGKLLDFITVPSQCIVSGEREISPFLIVAQSHFDTFVHYISTLDRNFGISGRFGQTGIECLVVSIGTIISQVEANIIQEFGIYTYFP